MRRGKKALLEADKEVTVDAIKNLLLGKDGDIFKNINVHFLKYGRDGHYRNFGVFF
jgi:hypothetical protein